MRETASYKMGNRLWYLLWSLSLLLVAYTSVIVTGLSHHSDKHHSNDDTTTSTTESTTTTANSNSNSASTNNNSATSIFKSLWESILPTIEAAKTAGTPSPSLTSSEKNAYQHQREMEWQHEQQQQQQANRGASNRRKILYYRSLETHFTEQIFTGLSSNLHNVYQRVATAYSNLLRQHQQPPLMQKQSNSKDDSGKQQEQDRLQRIEQKRSQLSNRFKSKDHLDAATSLEKPIRWRDEQSSCLYYRESYHDYWTYEWCTRSKVGQGESSKQQKHKKFSTDNSLGTYKATYTIHSDEINEWFEYLQTLYPTAVYMEHFDRGQLCRDSFMFKTHQRQLRRTAVLIHEDITSSYCSISSLSPSSSDSINPYIDTVDEPRTCEYIIHVCQPKVSNNDSNDDEFDEESNKSIFNEEDTTSATISETDAQFLNHTMYNIQKVLHTYLHQGQVNKFQRDVPDRTTYLKIGLPPMPPSRIESNLRLIRDMFTHAYDAYMYRAYPDSEIKPISCKPTVFHLVRIPALTLIDTLDTLVILRNYTEFARSVERLRILHNHMAIDSKKLDTTGQGGIFALNQNVSVFETNIRVLGGLLSAHQMAEAYVVGNVPYHNVFDTNGKILLGVDAAEVQQCANTNNDEQTNPNPSGSTAESCPTLDMMVCEATITEPNAPKCKNETTKAWVYDGFLLDLAHDIGARLLPAFETKTGIPYGTVNLLTGIPKGETTIASLAGGGTLSLELELLSRLTGDSRFGKAAKLASRALWMRHSHLYLFGKHLCITRGEWTEALSGIGSNSDSFYEYLIKHYILFPEDEDFWPQLVSAYGGIHNETRVGEWYADVEMNHGSSASRRVFEALMAFYPGMQVLLGELPPAARTLNSFFMIREYLGFLPERFNFAYWKVDGLGGKHHLRPELLESAYFMHRATKSLHSHSRDQSTNTNNDYNSNNDNNNNIEDNSGWLWAADFSLHALANNAKAECGFAGLKDLGPTTTGAVGHDAEGLNSRIKLINEMPSFFLSETLKYLYLTFDENNILHLDDEKDWVFTTEAHPIHYTPSPVGNGSISDLETLKGRVINKLQDRINNQRVDHQYAWEYLTEEKWAENTELRDYIRRMDPVVQQMGAESIGRHEEHQIASRYGSNVVNDGIFVEPFLSEHQVHVDYDFFGEARDNGNLAHLSFRKMGFQHGIRKACPNYYASDFFWIRALNGGVTDYADAYMSAAYDDENETHSQFNLVGAADALAMHGTGIHIIKIYDASELCPARQTSSKRNNRNDINNPATSNSNNNNPHYDNAGRFYFGEYGFFDIRALNEARGFVIQRIDSGETIFTTQIGPLDVTNADEVVFMVHASPGDSDNDGITFHDQQSDMLTLGRNPGRSVVMADLNDNAYNCDIEIIQKTIMSPRISNDDSNNENELTMTQDENIKDNIHDNDNKNNNDVSEKIIARYPCAPAAFGPTHIPSLVANGDISLQVEGIMQVPQGGDEYGCSRETNIGGDDDDVMDDTILNNDDDSTTTCADNVIQFVRRGICSFQKKSVNQRNMFNAQAVVVINNEDDELILMHHDEKKGVNPDVPPTVLITALDFEDMVGLTEKLQNEIFKLDDDPTINNNSIIMTRLSITKQQVDMNQSKNGPELLSINNLWPVVRYQERSLQIYAQGGWGVYAYTNAAGLHSNSQQDWQLVLIAHGPPPSSSSSS